MSFNYETPTQGEKGIALGKLTLKEKTDNSWIGTIQSTISTLFVNDSGDESVIQITSGQYPTLYISPFSPATTSSPSETTFLPKEYDDEKSMHNSFYKTRNSG